MKTKKGFTLVELLVVISIIAMLLAVLMPALGKAREQAMNIMCRANLRSTGQTLAVYGNDYNGKLTPDWYSFDLLRERAEASGDLFFSRDNVMWHYLAEDYWTDPKILYCPSAKKISGVTPPGSDPCPQLSCPGWGHTDWAWSVHAWGGGMIKDLKATKAPASSSYGCNDFACTPYRRNSQQQAQANAQFWGNMYQTGADRIPLLFDSAWYSVNPQDDATPTPLEYDKNHHTNGGPWDTILLPRHKKGINMLTMDFSVKGASIKSLWTYKWSKTFDTNNRYTKDGAPWPQWMKDELPGID